MSHPGYTVITPERVALPAHVCDRCAEGTCACVLRAFDVARERGAGSSVWRGETLLGVVPSERESRGDALRRATL